MQKSARIYRYLPIRHGISNSEFRTLSESGCRRNSNRQRVQNFIRMRVQGNSIRQEMQESLLDSGCRRNSYQTGDAGFSLSNSECRSLSIRQRMQETFSDTRRRSLSIRQWIQEILFQTADARVSLSDSSSRRHSYRQEMQESLYQTADA